MRIAYITAHAPFGPAEAFVLPELRALREAGVDLLVIPSGYRGEPVVHREGEALLACTLAQPYGSRAVLAAALRCAPRRPLGTLRALVWVLTNSRRLRHLAWGLRCFPKALWLTEQAHRRGVQHLHAGWANQPAHLARIASLVGGLPWSMSAHRGDLIANWALTDKLRTARFVRFISHQGLQLTRQLWPAARAREGLHVVHLGVELPPSVPPAQSPPVALCPANLYPDKGHRYLLQAVAQLAAEGCELELWLAGEGRERESLQRQAESLGIASSVRFLGQLPHQELLDLYAGGAVRVVALPSLVEGIPVSLMEAMAYGVPVIGTTVGGVPELLWGEAGLLVPPEDPAALAEALRAALDSEELRERLGRQGRARIAESFHAPQTAARLLELIRPHCAPPPASRGASAPQEAGW